MKNFFLISILILFFHAPKAQSRKFSAGLELIGGFGVVTYSNDSLVPPKRREKSRLDDLSFINGYFSYSLRPRLTVKIGIGYSQRDFQLNKNNLGDFFIAIFSFGSLPADTFRIQQVKMKSKYMNVPIGISYRLTKKDNKNAEFRMGLQVNGAFLAGQEVTATFDPSYFNPNRQQIIDIENEYAGTERAFVISIQPRMDIKVVLYRDIGLNFNLQPFIINLRSYNSRLVQTRTFLCLSFGTYLDI